MSTETFKWKYMRKDEKNKVKILYHNKEKKELKVSKKYILIYLKKRQT